MLYPATPISSTAKILATVGYSHRTSGIPAPEDNNKLRSEDELLFLHDDHDTEGDQERDQTGDDTLGRALKLDERTIESNKLAKHMEYLLKEFQLLLNQLRLCHDGVEMDPSLTNALSMNLQKLQRSLATADRSFKYYTGTKSQEIRDKLTKAYQHQIDAKNLHDTLLDTEPSSCPRLR